MAKLQKKRSSTPCLGICSTTFGDEVCKGCKRFSHEIVSWTKYSLEEREIIENYIKSISGVKKLVTFIYHSPTITKEED